MVFEGIKLSLKQLRRWDREENVIDSPLTTNEVSDENPDVSLAFIKEASF